jgi:hypothetical protein
MIRCHSAVVYKMAELFGLSTFPSSQRQAVASENVAAKDYNTLKKLIQWLPQLYYLDSYGGM